MPLIDSGACVTDLATRPKGIARDIKSDIAAVANTYQLKGSAQTEWSSRDAGSSHRSLGQKGITRLTLTGSRIYSESMIIRNVVFLV